MAGLAAEVGDEALVSGLHLVRHGVEVEGLVVPGVLGLNASHVELANLGAVVARSALVRGNGVHVVGHSVDLDLGGGPTLGNLNHAVMALGAHHGRGLVHAVAVAAGDVQTSVGVDGGHVMGIDDLILGGLFLGGSMVELIKVAVVARTAELVVDELLVVGQRVGVGIADVEDDLMDEVHHLGLAPVAAKAGDVGLSVLGDEQGVILAVVAIDVLRHVVVADGAAEARLLVPMQERREKRDDGNENHGQNDGPNLGLGGLGLLHRLRLRRHLLLFGHG